ncbi:DUF1571 domain-containing protein [Tautonia plasticadhaerens]|nr:DUF1571 domain-containing protein [Tautonia plasticadhaerens]
MLDTSDRSHRTLVPTGWTRVVLLCLAPVALAMAARWMVSAPLDAAGAPSPSRSASGAEVGASPRPLRGASVSWPEGRLEGRAAKRALHRALLGLVGRLEAIPGYEAVVRRRERIGGRWLPEQTLRLKVRHAPASVYLRDIGVEEGCEIIHVEGQRGGRLVSHPGGGLIGLLVPPVELSPTSPLAMTQSRFPITEAGVLPLARLLLAEARRDLDAPGASVVLDRVEGDDGRPRLRSVRRLDARDDGRPFARIEVQYDPETLIPLSFRFHDWPESPGEEPPLAGRYAIESFDPGAVPGDLDFDPTNPEYGFL